MSDTKSLVLHVDYRTGNDTFDISGDFESDMYREIIGKFLAAQSIPRVDPRKPKTQRDYRVTLIWYPQEDRFEATSNADKEGVRDGVLEEVLSRL